MALLQNADILSSPFFCAHFGCLFLAHSRGTVPYIMILAVPGFGRVAFGVDDLSISMVNCA